MPTISIFIRKDDVPKWQSLVNKSEWLHEQLDEQEKKKQRQADRQTSMDAPRPKPRPRPLDDVMALLEPTESKLSPEGVDAYEKTSGFKTTGDVTVSVSSDGVHNLTKQLYGPKPFVPRPPDPETGYPCCQRAPRCPHWHFDGVSGLWTNEITKKTREAV